MGRETGLLLLQTSSSQPWSPGAMTAGDLSATGHQHIEGASASQDKEMTPALRQARQFGYSAYLLCHLWGGPKLNVIERQSPQRRSSNQLHPESQLPMVRFFSLCLDESFH